MFYWTLEICAIEATHTANKRIWLWESVSHFPICVARISWQMPGRERVCVYCIWVWCVRSMRVFLLFHVHRHKFCVFVCAVLLYGRRHDQILDFNSLAVNKHWFLCRVPVVNASVSRNGIYEQLVRTMMTTTSVVATSTQRPQLMQMMTDGQWERAAAITVAAIRIAFTHFTGALTDSLAIEKNNKNSGDERIPIGKRRTPFNFNRQFNFSLFSLFLINWCLACIHLFGSIDVDAAKAFYSYHSGYEHIRCGSYSRNGTQCAIVSTIARSTPNQFTHTIFFLLHQTNHTESPWRFTQRCGLSEDLSPLIHSKNQMEEKNETKSKCKREEKRYGERKERNPTKMHTIRKVKKEDSDVGSKPISIDLFLFRIFFAPFLV